jgi:hypothetical protein
VDLENVSLAEGQLSFRIPTGWAETLESDGSAAFYDKSSEQGTLRVRVMTFNTEDDLTGHRAVDELESMEAEPGQTLESLPGGNALRAHREHADANGERTTFLVWLLASVDPPHRMRLAVFSFTVPAAREEEARPLIAVLEREIRAARFAHQLS